MKTEEEDQVAASRIEEREALRAKRPQSRNTQLAMCPKGWRGRSRRRRRTLSRSRRRRGRRTREEIVKNETKSVLRKSPRRRATRNKERTRTKRNRSSMRKIKTQSTNRTQQSSSGRSSTKAAKERTQKSKEADWLRTQSSHEIPEDMKGRYQHQRKKQHKTLAEVPWPFKQRRDTPERGRSGEDRARRSKEHQTERKR